MFKKNILKNQKGAMAVEGVLTMSVVLFLVVTILGWYTYLLPRQGLEKQVHLLAQKAKIQGGLTATPKLMNNQFTNLSPDDLATDVGIFIQTLANMGHDVSKIKVTCETVTSKTNCLGVTPYKAPGDNYVKRDGLEVMHISVEIPTKTSLLAMSKAFFGTQGPLPSVYKFSESVMSERW